MLKEKENYYLQLIKESNSLIDVCRKADISPTTGNYDTLKRVIKNNSIDITHFKRNGGHGRNAKRDIGDYLSNKFPIQAFKLKNRLLKEGLKEYKCENCGNTEWCGKPIPLELHHINGDNSDNRLENLQILCPNCHAFTDNYSGKNQKINCIKRYCAVCGKELHSGQKKYCSLECRYPKKMDEKIIEESENSESIKEVSCKTNRTPRTVTKKLIEAGIVLNKNEQKKIENNKKIPLIIKSLIKTKSYRATGKEFGVSDNAIRKFLHKRGFPKRKKELLAYISEKYGEAAQMVDGRWTVED